MTLHGAAALALAAGGVLLAACNDISEPTGPTARPDLRQTALQQPSPDDPLALARGVRGVGGFFLEAGRTPTVYLTDAVERGAEAHALLPFLRARGIDPAALRVLKG